MWVGLSLDYKKLNCTFFVNASHDPSLLYQSPNQELYAHLAKDTKKRKVQK